MTDPPSEDGIQFKIIIQADLLQELIDAMDALLKEFRVQFLDNHIRIWMVDPANVASIYVDMDPGQRDRIQHYSVQRDGFRTGLDIGKIDDLLGYADADTLIQMEYGPKHNWKFHITMPGVDVDLGAIDPDSIREGPDKPALDLPAHYRMAGESFKDAVDLNNMFSDHTTIRVDDHVVQFIAKGDSDSGTYSRDEAEEEVEFIQHPNGAVESMFSLDYLDDMGKVLKNYDQVEIHTGDEFPMRIETSLFEYFLAPRIDSSK